MKGLIENRIFTFTDILKDAGIDISTDEILSLFESFKHIKFHDRDVFKQTAQTTLVKDYTDIPVFSRCFDQFFTGAPFDEAMSSSPLSPLTEQTLRELEERLDKFMEERAVNELLEKNPEKLLAVFIDELIKAEASGGGAIGLNIFLNRRSDVQTNYSNGEGGGDIDFEFISNRLLSSIRRRLKEKNIGSAIKKREDYLLNKFIYQLKPDEIKEMRDIIRRFGQKLKNRISLRKKRVKRGGIDIRRTIRSSLRFDGIPFKIYFRNRKIDRPQLVVMCDISGSVNQYTRFMLLLTHSLQSLFSKVRTFAFISNMVEITDLFIEMDPVRAINSIFSDTDFTYGWGSNYGRSFNQFVKEHSDSLNKKTTVLILGDARNNNQDPGIESFITIKERSRNLFWLNPDKRHLWDWNDSIATIYMKYSTEMKEVNNFIDLSDFIDKLFRK